jgi:hypothetical protein
MRRGVFFALPLLLITTLPAPAGKDAGDYLTKDGKLKHSLEILDVQGGFAGFTGTLLSVQPDGSWKRSSVFQKKSKLLNEGTLSSKQLNELAAALAKYELLRLSDAGKSGTNPHNVSLTFGKHTCELRLKAGEKLPLPGEGVAGRYAGIVHAAHELCQATAGGQK